MPNINLIGTEPDQIPTNADLGTLAFLDQDYVNVGNLIVATVDITSEARVARFSTANATITGGSITGVTIPLVGTLAATNFSTIRQIQCRKCCKSRIRNGCGCL
jgi:hypothetical protein